MAIYNHASEWKHAEIVLNVGQTKSTGKHLDMFWNSIMKKMAKVRTTSGGTPWLDTLWSRRT